MTTLGQRAMQSRLLPHIYEAVWRPIGFTAAQFGRSTAEEARRVSELLDLEPSDRVLDVACGPGNTTRRLLAELGPQGHVTGVDMSETMLARAKADTADPRADYVYGDAAALPFEDASFDAVSCLGALYLMSDPMGALDEFARVLAPGGRVVVLTSVRRGPDALQPVVDLALWPSGLRAFGRDEVTDRLRRKGLKVRPAEVAGVFQLVSATKE